MKNKIFLGLGSNIGDTRKNLNTALNLLEEKVDILNRSSYYKTEPIGYKDQEWFLNMVVEGETELSPQMLLAFTQSIECKMKRVKTILNGPRIIDIDILLYNNINIETERLTIPHPRILERAFVVVPLCEIAPDIVIKGQKIKDALSNIREQGIQKDLTAMPRVNRILLNNEYLSHLKQIEVDEKDRLFCCHDMTHFLDVSRIAWIMNLEEDLNLNKEIVYATGLLHDIGRWEEYQTGIDHAIASSRLAGSILDKCGFTKEEKDSVVNAINNHRSLKDTDTLSRIIYKADKISRPCFYCSSIETCKRFQHNEKPTLVY